MDRASIVSLFPYTGEGSSTFSVMSITWSCIQNTLNPKEVKLIRPTINQTSRKPSESSMLKQLIAAHECARLSWSIIIDMRFLPVFDISMAKKWAGETNLKPALQ